MNPENNKGKAMKRTQNVILFSAGESVRNGKVEIIENKLKESGICCVDWRELFQTAHDMHNIALLPALVKKIPTFDFALIFAEAVDKVALRGGQEINAMRDNVIFELGMCIMALGTERVVLLAEESVHLPEDLIGVGKTGIEYITYQEKNFDESVALVERTFQNFMKMQEEQLKHQIDSIIGHIQKNAEEISPVFIGAAVASAEAYYTNFIVRLLEHSNQTFSRKSEPDKKYPFPEDFRFQVMVPQSADEMTGSAIADYYKEQEMEEFLIENAGMRGLFFWGQYNEERNELVIVDIPTSITASYSVVNSILNIDSDAEYDTLAEERFVTKELDIYAYTLKKLLLPQVGEKRLVFIKDKEKKKNLIEKLKKVELIH